MASSKISIIFILVLIYSNAGIIEGRRFPNGKSSMKVLMQEFSKMERNGRRVVVDITREAPQGPDPQHH